MSLAPCFFLVLVGTRISILFVCLEQHTNLYFVCVRFTKYQAFPASCDLFAFLFFCTTVVFLVEKQTPILCRFFLFCFSRFFNFFLSFFWPRLCVFFFLFLVCVAFLFLLGGLLALLRASLFVWVFVWGVAFLRLFVKNGKSTREKT